jgi:hypothetical protein
MLSTMNLDALPFYKEGKSTLHYIGPKLATQSLVLEPKFNDFKKKHVNDVEVHIFFHFQAHTTII